MSDCTRRNKVALLAFQKTQNYGAFLQLYASKSYIELLGYEVETINLRNKNIDVMYEKPGFIRALRYVFSPRHMVYSIMRTVLLRSRRKSVKIKYDKFKIAQKNLNLTKSVKNVCSVAADHYIVGSDQVWNPDIIGGMNENYFLHGVGGQKIAFSASVANNSKLFHYKNQFTNYLRSFDHVSVREESTKTLMVDLGICKHVVGTYDPVLLFSNNEWKSILRNVECKIPEEKYILLYVLEPKKNVIDIVNKLSEDLGLGVIHALGKKSGINNTIGHFSEYGPFEFLKLLQCSEFVVAKSFHGTVFSAIFNKQFISINSGDKNSRVNDFLGHIGLRGRVISDIAELSPGKIDYDKVNAIIAKMQDLNQNYLGGVLSVGK